MYVNGQRMPDFHLTRYVVVNYKKCGKCPSINSKCINLIINRNPVPKLTCEQVSQAVLYETKYQPDICGIPTKDALYVLQKRDGQSFDTNNDIFNLGSIEKFH